MRCTTLGAPHPPPDRPHMGSSGGQSIMEKEENSKTERERSAPGATQACIQDRSALMRDASTSIVKGLVMICMPASRWS